MIIGFWLLVIPYPVSAEYEATNQDTDKADSVQRTILCNQSPDTVVAARATSINLAC